MSEGPAEGTIPCAAYDVALLDLDGVVYIGPHAVDHAPDALARARESGMRLGFVTNNASRTSAEVAAHLVELGVPVEPSDVVTSAQAGARLVSDRCAPGSRVLAVGGPGVAVALEEYGLRPIDAVDGGAVAVLQGFGRDVGWRQLADASLVVRGGAFWVATNLDATLPVPGGRAPGNGMLVAAVAEAAGRRPDAVAGKPHAPLMRESVDRLRAERPLVVGDRLDTDIAGAVGLSIPSMLVLTGVTDVPTLLAATPDRRPTYVSSDLRGLRECQPQVVQVAEDEWSARASRARSSGGVLEVSLAPGREGWEDAVRCACAAVWGTPGLDADAAAGLLAASRP